MAAKYNFGKLTFFVDAMDGRISYSSSWNGDPVVDKMWTTNAWNVYKFIIDSALEDAWSLVYDSDEDEDRAERMLPAWHLEAIEAWGRSSITAWEMLQNRLDQLHRKL